VPDPTDTSTLCSCPYYHNPTLQHYRLLGVTTTVTKFIFSQREPNFASGTYVRNKQCMLLPTKLGAVFSRECAHPTMQPPIPTARPHPQRKGAGTSNATVSGALAWGRGKPPPAHCPSTARKPPTPLKASQAGALLVGARCRGDHDHAISSSTSWSRRSSRLWMSASLPLLRAHSR
jgi:hypothetical protein